VLTRRGMERSSSLVPLRRQIGQTTSAGRCGVLRSQRCSISSCARRWEIDARMRSVILAGGLAGLCHKRGAALLVDQVLPPVGYRQWVLSFSGTLPVLAAPARRAWADGRRDDHVLPPVGLDRSAPLTAAHRGRATLTTAQQPCACQPPTVVESRTAASARGAEFSCSSGT